MDWLANKHAFFSHLPVAVGLLLPLALVAAQRPGRGIRPWWTVVRYVGLMGLLVLLAALATGYLQMRHLGLLPPHRFLPSLAPGTWSPLSWHFALAVACFLVGAVALWAMNRPRKDYQSLGLLSLALGLVWCALLVLAGDSGHSLAHAKDRVLPAPVASLPAAAAPVPVRPPAGPIPPEVPVLSRALDHAALEPIHPDPVKSVAHGGRWVRAWANAEAAGAYRVGAPLPQGAFVVLSSMEDRWGRPGPEVGPLYVLEMKASGPALSFYWARIPEARRKDFEGEARAWWPSGHPRLESCLSCHPGNGMADPARRSRWRPARNAG